MRTVPPVILSIAGFDPSSGAGITADIKTIAAHECYGVTCITALTVQSTAGVRQVDPVAPEMVHSTLEELAADMAISAVHIGMLATDGVVKAVAGFLARRSLPHIVLDTILRSSSGTALLEPAGQKLLVEELLPRAEVITPNIDEAAALTGLSVKNLAEMKAAAVRLHELGAKAVVITGGHLDPAVDLLGFGGLKGWEEHVFQAEHLGSSSTHGTGCAFSTALACNLARGCALPEAVRSAKDYVTAAIANAYPLGKGSGPVNHLYRSKPVQS
jgi:hydroxymethylpyrimidine/phosphomethylpyrimidine kinase